MRYRALATDYDGTVAHHGTIAPETFESLEALKRSGRALLLVTGRELPDLERTCPRLDIFDRIVAENGALLYTPATRTERVLAEPPPAILGETLRARGVDKISIGKVIVATWEPHEGTVIETIRDLGLELQVIFNKGAVMVLPSGVNKASGLKAALNDLGLSAHNTIGVGDAENDHAFLSVCECGVAVANSLPALKERADITTLGVAGDGVRELIAAVIGDDLASFEPRLTRHCLPIGARDDETTVTVRAYGDTLLLAGGAASGTSTLTTALVEQLAERGYQFCLVDPEGDYSSMEHHVTLGDTHRPPSIDEVMEVLHAPERSVSVNLVAASLDERQAFVSELMGRLAELRSRLGRPHWVVLDEAHHVIPGPEHSASNALAPLGGSVALVTVNPAHLAERAIAAVNVCIPVGPAAMETLQQFCDARRTAQPEIAEAASLDHGRAIFWRLADPAPPIVFRTRMPQRERRHRGAA
jgi:HAD superfamily hydrolase (TIGR01484 family)